MYLFIYFFGNTRVPVSQNIDFDLNVIDTNILKEYRINLRQKGKIKKSFRTF